MASQEKGRKMREKKPLKKLFLSFYLLHTEKIYHKYYTNVAKNRKKKSLYLLSLVLAYDFY